MSSIRKGFKPQTLLIRDKEGDIVSNKEKVLQRWSEYCIMRSTLPCKMEWTVTVQTAEPHVEPPNDVDIEMTVSKLKNEKATGHDQIPPKLIKEGGLELKKVIYELI